MTTYDPAEYIRGELSGAPPEFPCTMRISVGSSCGHCGEPINAGYTEFRLLDAFHDPDETPCDHEICLKCAASTIRRWTKESGLTYKPGSRG
jgi:hypothetical protein